MAKRKNYLNNKDFLKEIHKSKMSYSFCLDTKFFNYDYIVRDKFTINDELIKIVVKKKIEKLIVQRKRELRDSGLKAYVIKDLSFDDITVNKKDLVFRLMTYSHIPINLYRKRKAKSEAEKHVKVNFPPFSHYSFDDNMNLIEVARSHWCGDIENGNFDQSKGQMTDKLVDMFIRLINRYSQKSNWRGYSYVEELKGNALLQITVGGLKFDESKVPEERLNPFAYATSVLYNAFVAVLNTEKRNQRIRDDLMIDSGLTPSFSRQIDSEINQKNIMNRSI